MSRPEETDPLAPMLDAAQSELARRLEDLCRVKHVEEESTGEFMRLEEKLLDAARAAKQAFSLRRRIRSAREGGDGDDEDEGFEVEQHDQHDEATDVGDVADVARAGTVASDAHVGVREVEDAEGVRWHVWAVTPQRMRANPTTSSQLGDYRDGWLTFESADCVHRRRLPHFPPDWETLDDTALAALLARAEPVRPVRPARPRTEEGEQDEASA